MAQEWNPLVEMLSKRKPPITALGTVLLAELAVSTLPVLVIAPAVGQVRVRDTTGRAAVGTGRDRGECEVA